MQAPIFTRSPPSPVGAAARFRGSTMPCVMLGLTAALPLPVPGPAGSRSSARPGLAARARAAAMVEDYYPVQWTGVHALGGRPAAAHRISNAGQVRGELLSVPGSGPGIGCPTSPVRGEGVASPALSTAARRA